MLNLLLVNCLALYIHLNLLYCLFMYLFCVQKGMQPMEKIDKLLKLVTIMFLACVLNYVMKHL